MNAQKEVQKVAEPSCCGKAAREQTQKLLPPRRRDRDKKHRSQSRRQSPAEKLKAERVQDEAKALGWQPSAGGWGLERVSEFPDSMTAAAYAFYLASFAGRERRPLALMLTGEHLGVTLYPKVRDGRVLQVNDDLYEFAVRLG
jgi:hypothetical protein